jgi:hypothetical protein
VRDHRVDDQANSPTYVNEKIFCAIVDDLETERIRQERLREGGKFTHTCATPGITDSTCTRVLQEEVDEALDEADAMRRTMSKVTRTMNDHAGNEAIVNLANVGKLRDELIQVMAVACAWVERLDQQQHDRELS